MGCVASVHVDNRDGRPWGILAIIALALLLVIGSWLVFWLAR